jgi:hypothetical protein
MRAQLQIYSIKDKLDETRKKKDEHGGEQTTESNDHL